MDGEFCPFIQKKCVKHKCAMFTHLVGMNPQTSQPTDEWGCSLAILPILLVENSNMTRHASASMDKVANEVKSHHASFVGALSEETRQRLINARLKMGGNGGNGDRPQLK